MTLPSDPFFILKECRELFVRRISDIARQCGVIDARVLDAMGREIGEALYDGLDATVRDFKKHDKARFYQDNFIEHIEFDYLEIQVIEED